MPFTAKLIQQIRQELIDRLNQGPQASGPEAPEIHADLVDVAQISQTLERETALREQGHRQRLAIEIALAKMAAGSFGICEDCGEDIPLKRLQLVPEARLCADCQAINERNRSRMGSRAAG